MDIRESILNLSEAEDMDKFFRDYNKNAEAESAKKRAAREAERLDAMKRGLYTDLDAKVVKTPKVKAVKVKAVKEPQVKKEPEDLYQGNLINKKGKTESQFKKEAREQTKKSAQFSNLEQKTKASFTGSEMPHEYNAGEKDLAGEYNKEAVANIMAPEKKTVEDTEYTAKEIAKWLWKHPSFASKKTHYSSVDDLARKILKKGHDFLQKWSDKMVAEVGYKEVKEAKSKKEAEPNEVKELAKKKKKVSVEKLARLMVNNRKYFPAWEDIEYNTLVRMLKEHRDQLWDALKIVRLGKMMDQVTVEDDADKSYKEKALMGKKAEKWVDKKQIALVKSKENLAKRADKED